MGTKRTDWNPNVAAWLTGQRGDRLQQTVADEISERGKVRLTRTWLSRIENGAPCSDDLLDALKDYYGSEPPPYVATPMTGAGSDTTVQPVPVDLIDLIDALAAQTAAISALAAQVKALAEAQPTGEELVNVLAAAVGHAVRETLRVAGVVDGTPPK